VRREDFDWSRPVDGSIEDTECSDEYWRPQPGEYELPAFVNPDAGFIQSANDGPWFATLGDHVAREHFPSYVFPGAFGQLGTRGSRQRSILARPEPLTSDVLLALVRDTFVPKAFHGVRALRRLAASAHGGLDGLSADARTLDGLLAAWDGTSPTDSTAMTAAFFLDRALGAGLPDPVIVASDDPHGRPEMRDPDVAALDPATYARALEDVAAGLRERYGTVEQPWGAVHVLSRPGGDLGIPGGANSLRALFGTWRGWWDEPDAVDPDGVQRCNFGTRTVRLTSLHGDETTVWSVTLTGQLPASEHPGSPHLLDQSELYAGLELKRFPLTRADVEADAAATDHAGCNHAPRTALSAIQATGGPPT
jgi:acyl-homoserine lactone acylase PvdQ